MKSGSMDSWRSALAGTGADIGGEPEIEDPLPRIGSVWTRDMRTFRTVGKHRFNRWGRCWHVQFAETREGEVAVREVSLRQFNKWAHRAKQVCDRCWGTGEIIVGANKGGCPCPCRLSDKGVTP
jgi:hypothetical protein